MSSLPSVPAPPLSPAFRRLAFSNLAAQFSEQVALAAAPLVAVLLLGAGAAETGYLQSAQTLPFLLLSLPAGVLADRFSRRRLMWSAEALRTVSLLLILGLLLLHQLTLTALAVLGFVGAVGTIVYSVSAPALVTGLVARDQLAAANRLLEVARSTAFAAGPAVGGAIVDWTGAPAAYTLATTLSLLAVVLLAGLPEEPAGEKGRRHLVAELRAGAGFVGHHPLLRPVLVCSLVFNIAWFVLQAVYVAYAVHRLGLSASAVGLTLGIYGAGMVAGALAFTWMARFLTFGTLIALGPTTALVGSVMLLATLWVPSGILAGVSFFLFGVGPILWTITITTLRQAVTVNSMLGRVTALMLTAAAGARPVGAAIGAVVAARFDVETCLFVSTACFVVQFVVLFVSPVPRLNALPQAPLPA